MATATPTVDSALYIAAHQHASKHRVEVQASDLCACFFCFRRFAPASIKAWIEGDQTALCPHCGLDAVLGSASPFRFDDGFLRKMHQHYFGYRSK
ncbi:MAG: cytoplasmic protein [Deltaproteobacteria bacterium]|nr:cytoplasmic protein [Deltaproteobacteria bacterium]